MSVQEIQQGIAAIQRGDIQQGDQLLRAGLSSTEVPDSIRAIGYMWLAETNPHMEFKIQCYQAAVQADPSNTDIKNRLNALIASQLPPLPNVQPNIPMPNPPTRQTQTMLPQTGALRETGTFPVTGPLGHPQNVPQMWEFGVRGGPNGIGTAFLVVRDGLLATTRYIVSDLTRVTLITRAGQELEADVVRSYPQYDLAFLRARINVPYLRDMTPSTQVAADTMLIADDYTEQKRQARSASTSRRVAPGWFPTTFAESISISFTGAPIIDDRDDLVGMLTRNVRRTSGLLFGLHISVIRRKIEEYYNEVQADPQRMYCGTCGSLSKAGADGLYYCELCGALLPHAYKLHRVPHPRAAQYYPTDMDGKKGKKG